MQLVSESVKSKQVQSLLQSEKQALGKQLQQINASLESLRTKIMLTEDQVRFSFLLQRMTMTCLSINIRKGPLLFCR